MKFTMVKQTEYKHNFDEKAVPHKFKIGDLVFLVKLTFWEETTNYHINGLDRCPS